MNLLILPIEQRPLEAVAKIQALFDCHAEHMQINLHNLLMQKCVIWSAAAVSKKTNERVCCNTHGIVQVDDEAPLWLSSDPVVLEHRATRGRRADESNNTK